MMRGVLSQVNSLVMAFLFALIVWAVSTSEQNPVSDKYLPYSLPVEVLNRPDDMLIYLKSTENVQVRLRAPQASWDQLTPSAFRVTADLTGLGEGLHRVPIKVQVNDPRVTVLSVEPQNIDIQLERQISREIDLRSEVLDAPPLGYAYRTPVITPPRVTISGPASSVQQVAEASVDVYLRGAKSTLEREVTVVARDAKGNMVTGLTISPTTALVRVPVEQQVGYKDVSIRASLKGTVAAGYWISNIVIAPSTVTLAGNPDMLAKIPGFIETAPIDVNGATSEVTSRATIALPDGVSILNNEGVTVQVSVTPLLGGQTVRRRVTLQGLRRGLSATVSPDTVEVILSGPVPSLQSLNTEDVQVFIDVSNLGAGTYQLKPRAPVVPDALKVQSIVPDTVQVTIVDLSLTPTVTPTPMPPPIATIILPALSTPTHTPTR